MCIVIEFKTGVKIENIMSIEDAKALLGDGLMVDELETLRDECCDDSQIVEAATILLSVIR